MDETLVITGGSRGIGLATARLFARHGYRVISLSRTRTPVEGAVHVPADLGEPGWCRQVEDRIREHVPARCRLVVVHNAGLLHKDTALNVTAETLERVLQVNLIAPAQLSRLLAPLMDKGSAILYVGSTLAERAVANACSYIVSKHALAGLMRATCQDLAGSGIHTACVCPGFTDTEMLREHVVNDQGVLAELATRNGMGRLVDPEEIAEILYFCARQPVVNGAVLHANLGQIER